MKNLFNQFPWNSATPGQAIPYVQPKSLTPGQAPEIKRKPCGRWTARPLLPLPKCLISQCFSQRAKMAMTGFLTCLNLVEKAKLLIMKEL